MYLENKFFFLEDLSLFYKNSKIFYYKYNSKKVDYDKIVIIVFK